MAAFDRYIEGVHAFADAMRTRGGSYRQFDCSQAAADLRESLPIAIGDGANRGVILRSDTFLELGNPAAGSGSHLLWTDAPSLIHDGRITLVGPDIPESAGASLPFAQVLMLAGEGLSSADHERLQQTPIVGDQIEGYMVRSTEENIWSRVSKGVAERGFDFEVLGKSQLALVKSGTSGITAMEILFVTSGKEDIAQLSSLAADAKSIGSDILKQTWKERGYDLDCSVDCSSCHDSDVCDDVRYLMVSMKDKARKNKAAGAAEADAAD